MAPTVDTELELKMQDLGHLGRVESSSSNDLSSNDKMRHSDGVDTKLFEGGEMTGKTASSEGESTHSEAQNDLPDLTRSQTRTLGKLKMRAQDDHDPTDWWFASTAIPLMAATFAPMANLLSIAALVVYWRNTIESDDPVAKYTMGIPVKDPKWCYDLNVLSLVCGFLGNLFLLLNFTQRIRYIVALPVTIFFFYLASGILIGIVVSMNEHDAPTASQVYSQGYWHAVMAACLYMMNSMMLMVNMLGYFLGHYPQHFTLTDEQRNLILQTMLFFIWLGGGAAVFTRIEQSWSYPDALYFCDVTILTIGFGDFFATNDLGRGLVFPFSVGGTIILGLMVNSIHKFARELSKEKVVRKHVEQRRVNTLNRAVTLEALDDQNLKLLAEGKTPKISSPLQSDKEYIQRRLDELAREEQEKRKEVLDGQNEIGNSVAAVTFAEKEEPLPDQFISKRSTNSTFQKSLRALTFPITKPVSLTTSGLRYVRNRNQKKILMLEERDRFNAMRTVQINASRFKRYYALTMSIISFSMLWCLGAMVFYFAEAETQKLNYFEGLYFCYVSLLTIGYGDLSPKSNAGKAFFVVWSLIAVPTMTILVSDLGDTVIGSFKRGVLHNDLGLTSTSDSSGKFMSLVQKMRYGSQKAKTKEDDRVITPPQLEDGQDDTDFAMDDGDRVKFTLPKTIDELADQQVNEAEMLKQLAFAIRHTAEDLRCHPDKKYRYEEWVEFSRLIRYSRLACSGGQDALDQLEYDEIQDGIVEWDWLDEKSPMASEQSESEWVLDRLCESLLRIFKRGDLLANALQTPKSLHSQNSRSGNNRSRPKLPPIRPVVAAGQHISGAAGDAESQKAMSAMTRLLQGEGTNSTVKWSKRAQAKMAMNDQEGRRRSSASMRHKKQGPFAALHASARHGGRGGQGNKVRHFSSLKMQSLGFKHHHE